MGEQTVNIVQYKPEVTHFAIPGEYKLKLVNKKTWIVRLALWLLEKSGCTVTDSTRKEIVYESFTLKVDDLYDFILAQKDIVYRDYGYRDIEKILVGYSQFNKLAKNAKNNGMYSAGYSFVTPKLMGMSVQVVPWLDGIVIVPKEENRVYL